VSKRQLATELWSKAATAQQEEGKGVDTRNYRKKKKKSRKGNVEKKLQLRKRESTARSYCGRGTCKASKRTCDGHVSYLETERCQGKKDRGGPSKAEFWVTGVGKGWGKGRDSTRQKKGIGPESKRGMRKKKISRRRKQ